MYYFGTRSKDSLKNVHRDLVLVHKEAIKTIRVDYGIHDGARTWNEQLKHFEEGTSKLDPRIPKMLSSAKHVLTLYGPLALATDIHVASRFRGKSLAWDALHLTYIVAYLIATADRLYLQGRISHKLRWGGNWDMDGVLQLDQNFIDNPHVELFKP